VLRRSKRGSNRREVVSKPCGLALGGGRESQDAREWGGGGDVGGIEGVGRHGSWVFGWGKISMERSKLGVRWGSFW